jgi:hypothetical protein
MREVGLWNCPKAGDNHVSHDLAVVNHQNLGHFRTVNSRYGVVHAPSSTGGGNTGRSLAAIHPCRKLTG